MSAKLYLFCVLVLESISGAVCYDYDVGGLVAASLAGFIFLAVIVLMIIVAVFWRDWYMRRQARRGRYRIPRERWRLFKYNVIKKSSSHVETPRSDRRMNMRMYNIAHMPSSKATTLDRQEPVTDAWVTRLPPANYYEEKSKTMKMGPEEENVIVADVLPDTNFHATHTTVQPVVIATPSPSPPTKTLSSTYQAGSRNEYVKVGTSQGTAQTIQLPQTTSGEPISYEPYHVQVKVAGAKESAQQLSQTTRYVHHETSETSRPAKQLSQTVPARGGTGDIFIQPIVPPSNELDNQTAGVVVFDSDDEAGNVLTTAATNQSEDLVLF